MTGLGKTFDGCRGNWHQVPHEAVPCMADYLNSESPDSKCRVALLGAGAAPAATARPKRASRRSELVAESFNEAGQPRAVWLGQVDPYALRA
jgi:hypothetical protein